MGLSLSKGQSLSLTKADGGSLSKVRMGLGWDSAAPVKRGLFGRGKAAEVDLDASAIFFDAAGKVLDTVWFQQLSSKDGSTRHTGDNLTGAGDGDDETILVDLAQVSAAVSQIVFVISSYSQQTFDLVENAFSRLVDDSSAGTPEVARYQLTDSGPHTAMIMSKVSRDGTGWTFKAIGERATGRSAMDLLTAAAKVL
ncbi:MULTISPECIES: TerD family protein [Cryobacterium]|uniref:TerD family protein n=1 Tax=Cryobacterium zongtaii TaxID=1259217 RepID=A0A2S3ZCC5_9MICO|nr:MULTISPECIES: TerD family protein [Cryobacterium]ASD23495.1 stress protein [Cryobacterium sp. LW097]MEC5185024.1 tellurium resistance protein TerZ [Cryobacterium sp. MP_3.1]POH63342.1 TerD family protein [Cryobacterium zongtaii]POH63492.1 TerD family protein [Cryobacterium zongtaii]POH63908.1 TerD family protein [Cryobacterium zongtaii]